MTNRTAKTTFHSIVAHHNMTSEVARAQKEGVSIALRPSLMMPQTSKLSAISQGGGCSEKSGQLASVYTRARLSLSIGSPGGNIEKLPYDPRDARDFHFPQSKMSDQP